MESEDNDKIDWLPVVKLDGFEYLVDIENRSFRQCLDPSSQVSFYSDTGREMIKALRGKEWRVFVPRGYWEKNEEQVV